jgi:CheY-like chemotaxis protein
VTARVLVADDEPGMRDTVREILEAAGYEVVVASDGDEALARLGHGHFDVVLLDLRMPGRDGLSVLRTLGEARPTVIIMTAYALEDQLQAVGAKAFAVLHKPVPVPHLLDVVGRAAGRAA